MYNLRIQFHKSKLLRPPHWCIEHTGCIRRRRRSCGSNVRRSSCGKFRRARKGLLRTRLCLRIPRRCPRNLEGTRTCNPCYQRL